jgi:hypothetical protein
MKSFDSIEKSLEERLDPKHRTIGEAQLQEHDQKKAHIPTSQLFRIEFSASVPEENKAFLSEKLPDMLDFPEKFGMDSAKAGHLLRFVDQPSYETEVGTALPKNVSLPASRIEIVKGSQIYKVMIILPDKLDTAEVIINITRNLFSKLYGNIFINEQILPMEFYQQNLKGKLQITAAAPEILDFVSELNFKSESLEKHCEIAASSYRLSMEKQGDEIRKQLIGEWREKWNAQTLTTEEQHTIDSMFTEIKESLRSNPEQFHKTAIEHVNKLNSQLHFILPHERGDYEFFKKKRFTHYIRSVLNKLEEISSLSGFIEELHSHLKNLPKENDLNGIGPQIRSRMRQMRKDKKVIQFYVPEMPQDDELENFRQKFPLLLVKMLPSGTPLKDWSKEVKRMEKHYAESIYSKLYAALHCFSEWTIDGLNKNGDGFQTSTKEQKLNKLLSVLKFRTTAIKSLQSMLGILLDISEKSEPRSESGSANQRQKIPLDEFRTAWSYFIASVLTLHFYQEQIKSADLPQGFHADNYTKTILRYVDRQCTRGINHFHIVKLLWLIYEERNDPAALTFLLYCIQNPQEIMRYILHQVMRPKSDNSALELRLEKLSKYRDAWISAYQNRLDLSED